MESQENYYKVILPDDITALVEQLAAKDGVTPDEWMINCVKQYALTIRALMSQRQYPPGG